jgi:hypothetical protein
MCSADGQFAAGKLIREEPAGGGRWPLELEALRIKARQLCETERACQTLWWALFNLFAPSAQDAAASLAGVGGKP